MTEDMLPLPADYEPPEDDDFRNDLLAIIDQFWEDLKFTAPELRETRFSFFKDAVETLLDEYE